MSIVMLDLNHPDVQALRKLSRTIIRMKIGDHRRRLDIIQFFETFVDVLKCLHRLFRFKIPNMLADKHIFAFRKSN